LVVVRDRLGLAADGDDRAELAVVGDAVADLALGRLAAGALRGPRHPALAEPAPRRLHVAVRLAERAFAVHHRRAPRVPPLLDERGGDLGHDGSSSVAAASGSAAGSGAGAASAAGSAAVSGAGSTAVSPWLCTSYSGASATGSAAGSTAGSAGAAC